MYQERISESYRNKVTLFIYYGMRALVILAIAGFLYRNEWESAFRTGLILLLMLVPSVLKQRYRFYLPFALDLGIVSFIFGTFFLGHTQNFYNSLRYWDLLIHFQSGLLLGITGFVLVYILNEHKRFNLDLSPGFIFLFAITFSIAFGAIWEIVEFAGDIWFQSSWQANLDDTMWDLIADSIGALIVSVSGYIWIRHNARLPFTPLFLKILNKAKKKLSKTLP